MIGTFGSSLARIGLLSAVLGCGGLVGCHHRQVRPVLLPAQTPVAMEPAPALSSPSPLVEAPKAKLPPVPVAHEEIKPKKMKKQRTRPAQVAAEGTGTPAAAPIAEKASQAGTGTASGRRAPEAGAAAAGTAGDTAAATTGTPSGGEIGVFSVGGEQSPRSKRDAEELIASNDRRLSGLGSLVVRSQGELISKVKTFQRDAQAALVSGDIEGAKTLATKGKLLLDDLDRGVPSQ